MIDWPPRRTPTLRRRGEIGVAQVTGPDDHAKPVTGPDGWSGYSGGAEAAVLIGTVPPHDREQLDLDRRESRAGGVSGADRSPTRSLPRCGAPGRHRGGCRPGPGGPRSGWPPVLRRRHGQVGGLWDVTVPAARAPTVRRAPTVQRTPAAVPPARAGRARQGGRTGLRLPGAQGRPSGRWAGSRPAASAAGRRRPGPGCRW